MSDGDPGQTAASLCARAELLIEAGRHADAVPLLEQAIGCDPHYVRARCALAWALQGTRDLRRALKAAEEAAALDPNEEWAHRLRSSILERMGRKRQSLEAARTAVRLDPDGQWALYRLACAEWENNRRRDAHRTAEHLRRVAPDWSFTYLLTAWFWLCESRWQLAEADSRRALELDPECWQGFHYLGQSLANRGRKKEAIEHLHTAARLNPGADEVRTILEATVRDYLWGGVTVVALLVGVAAGATRVPPEYAEAALLGALALLLLALLATVLWYRWRLRHLHPDVVAFYRRRLKR